MPQDLLPLPLLTGPLSSPGMETIVSAMAAPSFWPEILRLLGGLLGLAGLLFLAVQLARRFWPQPPVTPFIQVVATHYLTSSQALLVVAVGGQRFLLARSADQVAFLTSLPADEGTVAASPLRTASCQED